jgi:tetratricopeptide (TPR) repeat protein
MASNAVREVKIFVSSPGDVMAERQRLQRVVDRLNGRLSGALKFRLVRWEEGFYKSHDTFQAQIEQAAACDIVLSVFWTRLGTELPADFNERLPDGRPYPSGTAYEVLSALEAAREKALPDVYVFRKTQRPLYPDPENETETQVFESQLKRLRAFWEEWFRNRSSQFRAAFNSFGGTDEFEVQAENLLLEWLGNNGGLGRNVRWRIEERGSPFRGLLPFEAENSEVFFGRGVEIERGRERLVDAASRNAPFLLLLGASGSGKSSLARAGLIPRVTAPGVVEGVDLWRVARLTVGLGNSDPLIGLAAALLQPEALPELASTPNATPEGIATQLALGGEPAVGLVRWALEAAGERARKQDGYDRPVEARLILLVDQFEGHFTGAAPTERWEAFVAALDALVRSGLVWAIATLRSTEYALLQGNPVLLKLKEDGASLDLTAPDPVALAEAICAPAEAAGLAFERDKISGQSLDQILRIDASGADALPLLQFTLQHLFEAREDRAGTPTLTLDAYRKLGGIEGAIAAEAERAVSGLPDQTQGQLPWLLRQLVRTGRGKGESAVVLNEMTLDEAALAARPGARVLIDALVEARVLVLDSGGETGPRRGRLAHEAVLRSWERARSFVESNARYFQQSDQLQTALDRWIADNKSREFLLRGTPLSVAEDLLRTNSEDLTPQTRDFVGNSRRAANRGRNIAYTVAASMAVLSVFAVGAALYAVQQRSIADQNLAYAVEQRKAAERNFLAAKKTADSLVLNIAKGMRDAEGMRVDLVRKILDRAEEAYTQLASADAENVDVLKSQAEMQMEFAITYGRQGDTPRQLAAARDAGTIMQRLVARDAGNPGLQLLLALSYQRLGDVQKDRGELEAALKSYTDSAPILEQLLKAGPGNAERQSALAAAYDGIGSVLQDQDDLTQALRYFRDSQAEREVLAKADPENAGLQFDLSRSYDVVGRVLFLQGKLAESLKARQDSLAIRQRVAKAEPGNAEWQYQTAVSYNNLGVVLARQGKRAEALKYYQDSLALMERLASSDPGNAKWQGSLAVENNNVGIAFQVRGNLAEALKYFRNGLLIREQLAKADPERLGRQLDLAASYANVGSVVLAKGNIGEALNYIRQGLAIREQLAKSDPTNAAWQRLLVSSYNALGAALRTQGNRVEALKYFRDALAINELLSKAGKRSDLEGSYDNIGGVLQAQGDLAGATKYYRDSLAIREPAAKKAPDDPAKQVILAVSYMNVASVLNAQRDPAAALKYAMDALAIRERLAKSDPANMDWQNNLASSYGSIGVYLQAQGDLGEALKYSRDSLSILERLATADPENANRQSALAILYMNVASVLNAQSDPAAALKYAMDALAIRERLAKSDPANMDWQNNLASSYGSVGFYLRAQRDLGAALKYYRDGLSIRERLATADPENTNLQSALANINGDVSSVLQAQGDRTEALKYARDALAIRDRLAKADDSKQYDAVQAEWRLANLGDDAVRRMELVVDKLHKFRDDGLLRPDQARFVQLAEDNLKRVRAR